MSGQFNFFFRILSRLYVRSMFLMKRLHLTHSYALAPLSIISDKSFLMSSNHLRFGLPLLLFLGTSITITLTPTYRSSLLNMPTPLQPTFLHFFGYFSPLLSFLILAGLVTPLRSVELLPDITVPVLRKH